MSNRKLITHDIINDTRQHIIDKLQYLHMYIYIYIHIHIHIHVYEGGVLHPRRAPGAPREAGQEGGRDGDGAPQVFICMHVYMCIYYIYTHIITNT